MEVDFDADNTKESIVLNLGKSGSRRRTSMAQDIILSTALKITDVSDAKYCTSKVLKKAKE